MEQKPEVVQEKSKRIFRKINFEDFMKQNLKSSKGEKKTKECSVK